MNKKLAIKGHSTRGKEVIALLEMMGGINDEGHIGTNTWKDEYYFLDNGCIRAYDWCDGIKFTLEEFLDKYPFKVGDKVFLYDNITEGCVTGMEWDEDKGTVKYCVYTSAECWCDVEDLLKWNTIDLVEKHYKEQCDEMNEIEIKRDMDKAEFMIKHMILPNKMDDKLEYEIIDGYEFDRVDNNKIILKPIKPKYPKTYKECCDVLLIPPYYNLRYHTYEHCYNEYATSNTLLSLQDKLNTLGKLLICRNAYWKIAGEEMELGKPWEPDWNDEIQKYCIRTDRNKIVNCSSSSFNNRILAFPTEEMRDAFYENFKDLIEKCKELL